VADKRCENGHFIDEAWDICPYCPQDESEPEIPVVRPRSLEQAINPQPVPVPSPMPRAVPSGPAAAAPAEREAPMPRALPTAAAAAHRSDRDAGALNARPALAAAGSGSLSAVALSPIERTVAAQRLDASKQLKRYVVGWLVGLNGPLRGESFPLRMGRNVIGRDRRSDIVINDDQASSHHADLVFRPEERRFILMDHNSTNGTYVNETEIEPRRDLIEKDVVRIGSHRFLFSPLCHDGFHWDDEGPLK
jgi:FHA domain